MRGGGRDALARGKREGEKEGEEESKMREGGEAEGKKRKRERRKDERRTFPQATDIRRKLGSLVTAFAWILRA